MSPLDFPDFETNPLYTIIARIPNGGGGVDPFVSRPYFFYPVDPVTSDMV